MGQKLFDLVSPRGDFKLKTTLHEGGLVVNGWQLCCKQALSKNNVFSIDKILIKYKNSDFFLTFNH